MIKSNQNILRGITVMALTASLMSPTFASADSIDPRIIGGEENTGAVYSDPTYTSTEIEEFNNQAINFDAEIAAWEVENYDILYNPDGEFYSIPVTGYQQETTYWCGPASAKQSLSFHKSKSGSSTSLPSQTTLASKIGTTTSGSSTTGITAALNTYKSTYGFENHPYISADISNVSNPTTTFESRIKYDLANQTNAPIILISTQYLPRYGGKAIRHYNTISAYSRDSNTGAKEVKTEDPHYSSTYYGEAWNPLGSTTQNGVVRAVYQADLQGSNMAMSY